MNPQHPRVLISLFAFIFQNVQPMHQMLQIVAKNDTLFTPPNFFIFNCNQVEKSQSNTGKVLLAKQFRDSGFGVQLSELVITHQ